MALSEEQIQHIMQRTGCSRNQVGAFDYALDDFSITGELAKKKEIAKVVIQKEVKKGGKK